MLDLFFKKFTFTTQTNGLNVINRTGMHNYSVSFLWNLLEIRKIQNITSLYMYVFFFLML